MTIETTIRGLVGSAYMGHRVETAKGKKIGYFKLTDMKDRVISVKVGGTYMSRIYTILN